MGTTTKLQSPYLDIMRKFTEAHKEKCRSVVVDVPKEERPEKEFVTGSKYKGTWDVLGMSGTSATYTYPNGVMYKGDFDDGQRHGNGEMHFPNGEILKGRFRHGHMVERTLTFADGLEYSEMDWMYCKGPDRRYTAEYEKNVMPAGSSYITAEKPTREIPAGFYDTGDGFFDPKSKMVYKSGNLSAIIRAPNDAEYKWIIDNCRKAPTEPLGPRPDLYEEWLEPQTEPAPPPLPAVVSTATAWMFQSDKMRSSIYSEGSDMISSSGFSKWLRRIRQSSVEKAPFYEKGKSRTSINKSRSQSVAKTSATQQNQFRLPSFVKKPITRGDHVRKQIQLSSLVERSTSDSLVRPQIPRYLTVEKSTPSKSPVGTRSTASVVKNSTSENLVTFRHFL